MQNQSQKDEAKNSGLRLGMMLGRRVVGGEVGVELPSESAVLP
jgi:hypothetical protein